MFVQDDPEHGFVEPKVAEEEREGVLAFRSPAVLREQQSRLLDRGRVRERVREAP